MGGPFCDDGKARGFQLGDGLSGGFLLFRDGGAVCRSLVGPALDVGKGVRGDQNDGRSGQQIRQKRPDHASPSRHSFRSAFLRFTSPFTTRPPALFHISKASQAPFRSPALARRDMDDLQKAPEPML